MRGCVVCHIGDLEVPTGSDSAVTAHCGIMWLGADVLIIRENRFRGCSHAGKAWDVVSPGVFV
jgi:hypothetical protein